MMSKINYNERKIFKRCFKKLSKKFNTLSEDLEIAKRNAIELFHLKHIDNQSIVLMSGYHDETLQIYKLRKFACRSLKGKGVMSGIRVIYAYNSELKEVAFIEIYLKADQINEDKNKIKDFLNA